MKKFQMKRLICLLLGVAVWLVGCSSQTDPQADSGKLKVVTTLFPYYDFTRQIAGDAIDLNMVIPAGMDSHSFEPTPEHMRMIQQADVLICNGGAMEHWLEKSLEAIDTSSITVITMMDYVDVVEEEHIEGMEHDHAHDDHGSAEADHAGHDHAPNEACNALDYVEYDGFENIIEYDEHIWTSPVNAMKLTEAICGVLMQEDEVHSEWYRSRTDAYLSVLQEIDAGFREVSENRKHNMIVVGDKFPFRYLADEYAFDYRAAFSGCSSDTEPSAKTIAYLIDKVREAEISVVYYLELSSHRVSEIIGEETGAEPMLLHSCHSVSRSEFEAGITYEALMKQNIEHLRKGLDE